MKTLLTWFFENFDPSNSFIDHMIFVCFCGAIILGVFLAFAGIFEFIDRYIYPIKDKMVELFVPEDEDKD